jgi:hypothetical protein
VELTSDRNLILARCRLGHILERQRATSDLCINRNVVNIEASQTATMSSHTAASRYRRLAHKALFVLTHFRSQFITSPRFADSDRSKAPPEVSLVTSDAAHLKRRRLCFRRTLPAESLTRWDGYPATISASPWPPKRISRCDMFRNSPHSGVARIRPKVPPSVRLLRRTRCGLRVHNSARLFW